MKTKLTKAEIKMILFGLRSMENNYLQSISDYNKDPHATKGDPISVELNKRYMAYGDLYEKISKEL